MTTHIQCLQTKKYLYFKSKMIKLYSSIVSTIQIMPYRKTKCWDYWVCGSTRRPYSAKTAVYSFFL